MLTDSRTIVLATANARYAHCSLALRSLRANMGPFERCSVLQEYTLNDRPLDIVERILRCEPELVLLSVYIWNLTLLTEVASILRRVAPNVRLVLGGPEVSFESDLPDIARFSDHIIAGEAELQLPRFLEDYQNGSPIPFFQKAPPPDLYSVSLPLGQYTDEDIAHRTLYVETSRGCTCGCEFCLSSLDRKVRYFDPDRFNDFLNDLFNRGARKFKFIDRTIHTDRAITILQSFLSRPAESIEQLFLHFEIIPEHITDPLISLLSRFPPGAVQLEAGVQTLNPDVAERIRRRLNWPETAQTFCALMTRTSTHLHTDLVAGLPGETTESFLDGFDRLFATGVQEIQLGILKRLRGAPIDRHTESFKMVYRASPPYDVLTTAHIPFTEMQRLKRLARTVDKVFNSGNYPSTMRLLIAGRRPSNVLLDLSDHLYENITNAATMSLDRLTEYIFHYLVNTQKYSASEASNALFADYRKAGRTRFPGSIRRHVTETTSFGTPDRNSQHLPHRQRRHLRGTLQS